MCLTINAIATYIPKCFKKNIISLILYSPVHVVGNANFYLTKMYRTFQFYIVRKCELLH